MDQAQVFAVTYDRAELEKAAVKYEWLKKPATLFRVETEVLVVERALNSDDKTDPVTIKGLKDMIFDLEGLLSDEWRGFIEPEARARVEKFIEDWMAFCTEVGQPTYLREAVEL